MIQLQDQTGTTHSFAQFPVRIVSLVPSQTELLCDLGLEDAIVGITKFCVHPNHLLNSKKVVGGTKKLFSDKIKILLPDIIICNKEENTEEIVIELSKICPVWVTNIISIEDNLKMISDFGTLFNQTIKSQALLDTINASYANFQNFIQQKPLKRAAYFIWANPYMVAANDTFINEMMKINRFQNVYQDQYRYPEVVLENIEKDKNLELLFLSSEPFPFKEKHVKFIKNYVSKAQIILVDGEMFSWHGSRILKAFEYFKLLHQQI